MADSNWMYVGDSIPFEPILEPNWVKKILDNVQIMRIFLPFSFPAESTKRKKLSFKMYQSEPPSKSLHLHKIPSNLCIMRWFYGSQLGYQHKNTKIV